jgi:hypothetical protein
MLSGMAELTPLTSSEIEQLAREHPDLPADYLSYLRDYGWGSATNGQMIYSGPISPSEIYPHLQQETNRVIIGDDMQGYCLAYDLAAKRYGEFSNRGDWRAFAEDFDLTASLTNAG